MTEKNEFFVSLLRSIRANLDLTQEQLADRLGVSFATVNRWEGGHSKPQKAPQIAIFTLAEEAGLIEGKTPLLTPTDAAQRVTSRRTRAARDPKHDPTTTKSMEQMLWGAACSIRGEKDAAKFKDYLLPLVFIKRLSDVFDDEVGRIADEYGNTQMALELIEEDHALVRFYIPPEARWGVISGRDPYTWPQDDKGQSTAPKDIGEHLTKAVRAITKYNPKLSGVIDVVDFANERNGERDINPAKLRNVVETFSDPRYRLGLADVQPDFLGRAYEYLLRKFAEGSGQSAGEFFTPTEVGFLIARILKPKPGQSAYDYACGSGGLLIKQQLVARELDPTSKVPLKLYGQEIQAESYAVARMNAIIHDMTVELERGDTIINPKHRTANGQLQTFDLVAANPMWNQPMDAKVLGDDPYERFLNKGGLSSGKGDWPWLQHTLSSLNDSGRAAVVLDTGAVTRGSGSKQEDKERNIRKWFVEQDYIEGVILLPENLFYNTTAAGVIIVLNKRKNPAKQGKIILLNASKRFKKGKPKNYIPEEDIRALAAMYDAAEPVEGELVVIKKEDVAGQDYNLSPSKWVSTRNNEIQRPIRDLVQELLVLDEQAKQIDIGLAKLLGNL